MGKIFDVIYKSRMKMKGEFSQPAKRWRQRDYMVKKFCICYASSNEYAQYTGISLLSLLENNTEIIDNIYLLSFGIKEENIQNIQRIVDSYKVRLIVIDAISKMSRVFAELEMLLFEGSYATYARAFIASIIDDYDGKLLYIDSDTVVDGSLLPIKELDLESQGKVYAGVIGMNQYVYPYSEIKLNNGNSRYYACGVLLFDMSMWKKMKCTEKIVDYIKNANDKNFRFADQTVINNCIPESLALPLDIEYNYWGHMFRGKRIQFELTRNGFYTAEQVQHAKEHPVIIHYKGYIVHPWLKGNVSSLSDRYQFYKQKSPWRDEKENTIYFSENDDRETPEQRKKMRKSKLSLRYPVFIERIIENLVEFKHRISGMPEV